jgi:hypothetical protein
LLDRLQRALEQASDTADFDVDHKEVALRSGSQPA